MIHPRINILMKYIIIQVRSNMVRITFILLAVLVQCSAAVDPSKELDDVLSNINDLENIIQSKKGLNPKVPHPFII